MDISKRLTEADEADYDAYNMKLNRRRLWQWPYPRSISFTLENLQDFRWKPLTRRHHVTRARLRFQIAHRRLFSAFRLVSRNLLLRRFLALFIGVIILTSVFFPSYTHLPPHYGALRSRSLRTKEEGRSNPSAEQVFIAVNLYDKDGYLAEGAWGQSVLDLIDLLGPQNVFLSIYQSDSGFSPALEAFEKKVKCRNTVVNDLFVSKDDFPKIMLPDGNEYVKRTTYLSEMRNRALRPLDQAQNVTYNKVLFLNDIYFDPIDAAQLLFSTNIGQDGRTQYVAACALDYSNPFRFYDLFVTRDLEGYRTGVPFFPIFSNAGKAESRSDILRQKDAVRVKSCWSGMVAMQARYIQSSAIEMPKWWYEIGAHIIDPASPRRVSTPVRFRAEPELYLDACECCLFLADLLQVAEGSHQSYGIYVNPFVRVAYDARTLSWLPLARRFERLFSWPHRLVNAVVGLPTFNPYRTIKEGELFDEEIWLHDSTLPGNGSWHLKQRTGRNGLYCDTRETQVLKKSPRTKDDNWLKVIVPPGTKLYLPS